MLRHVLANLISQMTLLWYYYLNFKIINPDSDTVSDLSKVIKLIRGLAPKSFFSITIGATTTAEYHL